jgi:hypothetical protein
MADAAITALADQLSKLTLALSNTTSLLKTEYESRKKTNEELEDGIQYQREFNEVSDDATDAYKDAAIKYRKATHAVDALKKKLDETGKTVAERAKLETDLADAVRKQEKAKKELTIASLKASKAFRILTVAASYLSAGLVAQRRLMTDQVRAQAGLVEGTDLVGSLMKQQAQAVMRGVDPGAFAKIMASNRQMVNAMGGISSTLGMLDPATDRLFGMTVNLEEAMELAAQQASRFVERGVRPTTEGMLKYTRDLEDMARMTGLGAAEMASLFDEVERDTDMMHLLRAARDGERQAILENQRALIKQNVALGMTAEQAKEAAKMLNKMVAAKPLDRLKQAARIRALGAAMGVGGADAAAAGIVAGPRATAAQKAAIRDFSVAAASAADTMRGAGLGSEIFATTLLDKLDLEQYLGMGSPFSVSTGQVIADGVEKMKNAYTKAADSAVLQVEKQIQILQKILGAVIDGSLLMNLIITPINALWKFFSGQSASNWISEGFSKTFPKLYALFSDVIGVLLDGVIGVVQKYISGWAKLMGNIPFLGKLGEWGNELGAEADRKLKSFAGGTGVSGVASSMSSSSSPRSSAIGDVSKQNQAMAATVSTASGVQKQLTKMDENTGYLKTISEVMQKQLELSNQQLAAMEANGTSSGITSSGGGGDWREGYQGLG